MVALRLGKRYPKKHGSTAYYKDEVLTIDYDTYAPNLTVRVNKKRVLYFHLGDISSYIPDSWVDHLKQLAAPVFEEIERETQEKAKKKRLERLRKWGLAE
jgi:hypothetical protein